MANPNMRDAWGCVERTRMAEPTFVDEENGERVQYWQCPTRFIPLSVLRFVKRYSYHKRFPSSPIASYEQTSERWVNAVRIYEEAYAEGLKEKKRNA